jgi:hypothetical protein
MTPDDRERMYQLCSQIEKEQDHHCFRLIKELNNPLDARAAPESQSESLNQVAPHLITIRGSP